MNPHLRRTVNLVGFATLLVLSGLVYLDAASHAYRRGDGTPQQPPGAFVTLERWIGATRPTRWARPVEYGAAALLGIGAVLALRRALQSPR